MLTIAKKPTTTTTTTPTTTEIRPIAEIRLHILPKCEYITLECEQESKQVSE